MFFGLLSTIIVYRRHAYLSGSNVNMRATFGFIMIRCVRKYFHNEYWIESYRCIRQTFPNAPILIIDDYSDENLIDNHTRLDEQAQLVRSELEPGLGELLGYYYFKSLRPFDKAVILHDSMFLQHREPLFSTIQLTANITFLWHFDKEDVTNHNLKEQEKLISVLEPSVQERLRRLRNSGTSFGCFGGSAVISLGFLEQLEKKYGLFNLLSVTRSRGDRMAFERVFAYCCIDAMRYGRNIAPFSVFGNIFNHYGCFTYNFWEYLVDKSTSNVLDKMPCIKVWSGR